MPGKLIQEKKPRTPKAKAGAEMKASRRSSAKNSLLSIFSGGNRGIAPSKIQILGTGRRTPPKAKAPQALPTEYQGNSEQFLARLGEVMKADAIPGWLKQPNASLGGRNPNDLLERGEMLPLWRILYYLESSIAT